MDAFLTLVLFSGALIGLTVAAVCSIVFYISVRKFLSGDRGSDSRFEKFTAVFASNPETENFREEILKIFDEFMMNKLTAKLPVLNMFMDDKLIAEIRVVFHEEMEIQLPMLLNKQLIDNQEIIKGLFVKADRVITKKISNRIFLLIISGATAGALINVFLFFGLK